mmetsp:Transcript_33132/g.106342  ORF Transcript_33132/g.106342 Transcript_33132/m.106342 type:complete len:115 (-) Transcript_33132:120-464(-)
MPRATPTAPAPDFDGSPENETMIIDGGADDASEGEQADDAADEQAWQPESPGTRGNGGQRGKQIFMREFYAHRLQVRERRDAAPQIDDALHRAGRLFQSPLYGQLTPRHFAECR